MSFDGGGDLCLGFWQEVYEGGHIVVPPQARVLEIGCAEADWLTPMKAARPDLHLTGIDWRSCVRPGADVLIQGDILTHVFPPQSFEVIVAISTLEHIGLGHYNGDPAHEDGDVVTAQRMAEWLVPGGMLYFDVPYRPDGPYAVHGSFRAYDQDALASRLLSSYRTVWSQVMASSHPDAPYIAVVATR